MDAIQGALGPKKRPWRGDAWPRRPGSARQGSLPRHFVACRLAATDVELILKDSTQNVTDIGVCNLFLTAVQTISNSNHAGIDSDTLLYHSTLVSEPRGRETLSANDVLRI